MDKEKTYWTCLECNVKNNYPNSTCGGCKRVKPRGYAPRAGLDDPMTADEYSQRIANSTCIPVGEELAAQEDARLVRKMMAAPYPESPSGGPGLFGGAVEVDTVRKTTSTGPKGVAVGEEFADPKTLKLIKEVVDRPDPESPCAGPVAVSHIPAMAIQPVEFIEKNMIGHLAGNIITRAARFDKPTGMGLEDLENIKKEVGLLIELRYHPEPGVRA